MNEPSTEDRLRDSLDALAGGVTPRPDAYECALHEWRRRERRRRVIAALLACLLVAGADAVGLWALNSSASSPHPVVFDGPPPAGP
jgi:hypothetical protein